MELTFSNRLKKVMVEKGISQSQLSKISGIAQSSISDWLKGKYEPKQDKIESLAYALDIHPTVLTGWDYNADFREKENMRMFLLDYGVDIEYVEDPHRGEYYELVYYKGEAYGEVANELFNLYLELRNLWIRNVIQHKLDDFFYSLKKNS